MSVPKVFVKKRISRARVSNILSRDEEEESYDQVEHLIPTLLVKKQPLKEQKQQVA